MCVLLALVGLNDSLVLESSKGAMRKHMEEHRSIFQLSAIL